MLKFDPIDLLYTLYSIPCILLALTCHEVAHGWVAYKLGDPTARNFGRLTLNPLKHLDPIGTLSMIFFGFGWAKAVPVNTRYFKKPKRDMALTALAGPITNLILGFIGMLLYVICMSVMFESPIEYSMIMMKMSTGFVEATKVEILKASVMQLLTIFFSMNISLAVFNLIPLPPLDGSKILGIVLPTKWYFKFMQYERYVYLILIVLLVTDVLTTPLLTVVNWIASGMLWIINLIPFLG